MQGSQPRQKRWCRTSYVENPLVTTDSDQLICISLFNSEVEKEEVEKVEKELKSEWAFYMAYKMFKDSITRF